MLKQFVIDWEGFLPAKSLMLLAGDAFVPLTNLFAAHTQENANFHATEKR